MDTLASVIKPTVLAKQLDISKQAVWKWFRTGHIPAERVLSVERATGISRSKLRPDIYPPEDRAA